MARGVTSTAGPLFQITLNNLYLYFTHIPPLVKRFLLFLRKR